jgi:signal transduction histidine kinase
VQEALTNIVKHAAARHVTVALRPDAPRGPPGLLVVVHDDGRASGSKPRPGATHGLMGMRYRVEAENGEMHVHARPGEGTRIEAWLPLAAPAAPAGPAGAASEASDSRPAPLPTV